jgi:heme exporter protein A
MMAASRRPPRQGRRRRRRSHLSAAVQSRGLCRRYGRRWALVDVTFDIEAGSVVMLTGRNGSGKSTLLRCLSTAIRPDRGSAAVGGHDVVQHREQVRRQVASLSHYTYLYEPLTALDNLRIAARFLGRPDDRESLQGLLAEVGLADRADDAVMTYSAGMRKRLALARTLLQEARVVMLDEPYGQLDPPGFRWVDRLFASLKAQGKTVLVATHQVERVSHLCDLGLVLEEGRLRWFGPAADLPRSSGLEE